LVSAGIRFGLEPDAGHVTAREPGRVLGHQPQDGTTLLADQVVRGDADGPAESRGLRNDLVGRG
jgi:hypothetical protein